MRTMYSFDSKVRYSEVDCRGGLTLGSILDYFQDSSSFHSEELGVGISYLEEVQMAWILVSWQIEVERTPAYGEDIRIATWPYEFKGFYGSRNFLMSDREGRRLAYANSLWVLLDLRTGRPAKVPQRMQEAYRLEPPLSMERTSRKIMLPPDMVRMEPFPVHNYHLDTNQHVNNGKYVMMAQEYLPDGFGTVRMRAEYKKSAVLHDSIYPLVKSDAERVTVVLGDKDQRPYAIVELEGSK